MLLIAIYLGLIFLYSLASARLARTSLTAPILFASAGMLTMLALPELRDREGSAPAFLRVAEIGLVLLLFADASRTDLGLLRSIRSLPARLLGPGMLLTIILGALAALAVFDELTIWEAGILTAILAPTDAGLGQVIVNSPLVPRSVRQALNVEAGLNDGLSVPFLLFFIAMAAPSPAGEGHRASLMHLIAEQLGIGVLIGGGVGLVGGALFSWARRRTWSGGGFEQLGVVALPILCMLASEPTGASMFIAAFVAGLAAQIGFRDIGKHGTEFSEQCGQLLNLFVFFLFGVLVLGAWDQFTFRHVIYAVVSLTVVRILPVAIALLGTRMSPATVLFMGWFGPRGLASIVLALVFLEHGGVSPHESTIKSAVMVTVLLSIFAHGLSAMPGIRLYSARILRLNAAAPERTGDSDAPTNPTPGSPAHPEA